MCAAGFLKVAVIIAAAACGVFVLSVAVVALIYFFVFKNVGVTPRFFLTFGDLEKRGFSVSPVYIKIGKKKIRGYFSGDPSSKKLVVISHGIQSDSSSYAVEAEWFAKNGFYVFSYDNFGCGESDGRHSGGLVSSAVTLDKILSVLEENYKGYEIVLYGHSWGGYAVSAAFALGSHSVKRAVSVCPYNKPARVSIDCGRKIFGAFTPMLYPAVCVNLFFQFGRKGFLTAADGINSSPEDARFLVIQAERDDIVGFKTSSLYSDKSEIKNPEKAEFIIKDRGHNSCMLTGEAAEAEEKFERERLKKIRSVKDFASRFERAEREKYSILDEEFMQKIAAFFNG